VKSTMESSKVAYGALLVFIGGLVAAVGLELSLAGNFYLGIPMILTGAYLAIAIFDDHLFKHKFLRYFWREQVKRKTAEILNLIMF
jgi:hypothetical protein